MKFLRNIRQCNEASKCEVRVGLLLAMLLTACSSQQQSVQGQASEPVQGQSQNSAQQQGSAEDLDLESEAGEQHATAQTQNATANANGNTPNENSAPINNFAAINNATEANDLDVGVGNTMPVDQALTNSVPLNNAAPINTGNSVLAPNTVGNLPPPAVAANATNHSTHVPPAPALPVAPGSAPQKRLVNKVVDLGAPRGVVHWVGYNYNKTARRLEVQIVTEGKPIYKIFQEVNRARQPEMIVRFLNTEVRHKIRRDIDASEFRSPVAFIRMRRDNVFRHTDVILTMRDPVQPRLFAKGSNIMLTFDIPERWFGPQGSESTPVAKVEIQPDANVMPVTQDGSDPVGTNPQAVIATYVDDPGKDEFNQAPADGGVPLVPAENTKELVPVHAVAPAAANQTTAPQAAAPQPAPLNAAVTNVGNTASSPVPPANQVPLNAVPANIAPSNSVNGAPATNNAARESAKATRSAQLNTVPANVAPANAAAAAPKQAVQQQQVPQVAPGQAVQYQHPVQQVVPVYPVQRPPVMVVPPQPAMMPQQQIQPMMVPQQAVPGMVPQGQPASPAQPEQPSDQGQGADKFEVRYIEEPFTVSGVAQAAGDYSSNIPAPITNSAPISNAIPMDVSETEVLTEPASFEGPGMDESNPAIQPAADIQGVDPNANPQHATAKPKKAMKFDFRNATVGSVLRAISSESGLNFVMAPEVSSKKITVSFNSVSWDVALKAILEANRLGMEEIAPKTVRVDFLKTFIDDRDAQDKAKQATDALVPTKLLVMRLSYADATTVSALIEKMLPKSSDSGNAAQARNFARYKVNSDKRSNSIIVEAVPSELSKIKALIERLDTQTPQVKISSRIVEVLASAEAGLGISWGSPFNIDGGRGLGFGALPFPNNVLSTFAVDPGLKGESVGVLTTRFGSINNMTALDLKLKMLESNNQAESLQNQDIMVEDNQTATIEAGSVDYFNIPAQGLAGPTLTEVKYNTSLKVIPHITADGSVQMGLDIKGDVPTGASATTAAGKLSRSLTTTMLRRSGDTAVIGGLYSTDRTKVTNGIPILSKLPIIGALFRSNYSKEQRRDLLIMVTPTIVNAALSHAEAESAAGNYAAPANTAAAYNPASTGNMALDTQSSNQQSANQQANGQQQYSNQSATQQQLAPSQNAGQQAASQQQQQQAPANQQGNISNASSQQQQSQTQQ